MSQKEQTLEYLKKVLVNLKYYKTDLAIDLLKIFADRAERFKNEMMPEDKALVSRHIEELKPNVMTPRMKNKLYIVSDIERITLISLGISDAEVKQLINICSPTSKFTLPPEHIVSIYIFNKEKLLLSTDIYPYEFSAFIKNFNERNLIVDSDIMDVDSCQLF